MELVERIGAVLRLPVAYFYAVDDEEAMLVAAFNRMSQEERKAVLALALKGSQ